MLENEQSEEPKFFYQTARSKIIRYLFFKDEQEVYFVKAKRWKKDEFQPLLTFKTGFQLTCNVQLS